jgi:hypothetical protein
MPKRKFWLDPNNPTYIYAFAISPNVLPNFHPQHTLGSFFSSHGNNEDDRNNVRSFEDDRF